MNKQEILKNIFGHENFRDSQEQIIDAILDKSDVLAILPTGGGKSLCYQLPAFLSDGLVVVVSPLIALMQDQVKALCELNIKAAMINSIQNDEQNAKVFSKLKNRELKFLYLAPERLVLGDFVNFLTTLDIAYFVIDEAHCVSNWGHEFRKDYRNLGQLKANFPNTPILAFTATATKKVTFDIMASLNLNKPKLFRAITKRDNLFIHVKKRISNGQKQILQIIKNHQNQCGIVYTFSRKDSEKVSEFLNQNGIKSSYYHAKLSTQKRKQVYEDFAYENIQIVVATIAFGMGIDKSNIRFIIHTSLPKTLENYYQEIGRAGRDGDSSSVYLLYSKSDEILRLKQIEENLDDDYKELSKEKLKQMYRFCISLKCRHEQIAKYFQDCIAPCKNLCDNCQNQNANLTDISLEAQKLLSAIYRTNQSFGANYVIDILRASKNKRIQNNDHDKLSVYGIGENLDKNQWHNIIDVLLDEEIMTLNEFKVLSITQRGFKVLKGEQKVQMRQDLLQNSTEEKVEKNLEVNEEIFDKFKDLRKKIALQTKVPAYIIFDDKALKQMANTLPLNEEEFLKINGVGQIKLQKYGSDFLTLCKQIKDEYQIPNSTLSKTHLETLKFLNDGNTIAQITKIRDLQENTIISHVSLLCEHKRINEDQKTKLFSQIDIPKNIQDWIDEGLKLEQIKKLRDYLFKFEILNAQA